MGSVWSSSSIIKLWPNSTFVCIRWSEGRVERKKKYSLKQDLSSEENDSAILFLGLLDQLGIGWCIWENVLIIPEVILAFIVLNSNILVSVSLKKLP